LQIRTIVGSLMYLARSRSGSNLALHTGPAFRSDDAGSNILLYEARIPSSSSLVLMLSNMQRTEPSNDAEKGALIQVQRKLEFLTGKGFEAAASKIFNEADTNKDGQVDVKETYELVLKFYILINRRAPIKPPSKEVILQLFNAYDKDVSGKLTKKEFCGFCSNLVGRAAVRIAGFNAVRYAVAPLLAAKIASEWVLPILDPSIQLTLLTLFFVAFLGNVILAAVDALEVLTFPQTDST